MEQTEQNSKNNEALNVEAKQVDSESQKSSTITFSQLAYAWDHGLDISGATPHRPKRAFSQVDWVFICIDLIVRTCRDIQLMISTANDQIVESGPAYDLLFNNPDMSFNTFITETVGFLALDREVYWVYTDLDNIAPKTISVISKKQIKPVIQNNELVGYIFQRPDGTRHPLLIDEVYPLIDFNPDDKWHGAGPTDAGKIAMSTSYQAALLNESTLANGGKIGNLITMPQGVTLNEEEKAFFLAQFDSRHGGVRKAGKTCLMTGGADVKNLSQTMADLQMLDLRRFDAGTICSMFGVPPEVVGLNSEAQYAHGPAQQRFIVNTISSMLSFVAGHITQGIFRRFRFRKHLNKGISPEQSKTLCSRLTNLKTRPSFRNAKRKALQSQDSIFAWFAMEDHPTVQEMLRDRADKVLKYTDSGVPLNQIIDAYDLPFEHTEAGDHWWVTMGLVPADYILEGGIEAVTGESLPEGETGEDKSLTVDQQVIVEKAKSDQKNRVWQKWVASWQPLEREYKSAIRGYFIRQRRELIKKLKDAWSTYGDKSITTKDVNQIIAEVTFDLHKENSKIKVIHKTFFTRGSELGAAQTLSEVEGLSGETLRQTAAELMHRSSVRRALTISSHKITKVNVTTQKMVAKTLRQGLEKGESMDGLTKRIRGVLDSSRGRAKLIARTNTAGAVSTGRHEGLKHAGVELKGWLDSKDENVRQSHREAAAKYVDGIPVNQPFIVGSSPLMYPGDPNGSIEEIANCRCMEIARVAKGKSFDLNFYDNVKFINYLEFSKAA